MGTAPVFSGRSGHRIVNAVKPNMRCDGADPEGLLAVAVVTGTQTFGRCGKGGCCSWSRWLVQAIRETLAMLRFTKFALLLFAFFAASPASADISRSCRANVVVTVIDNKLDKTESLADIEGRGSCSGKHKANECRSRARGALNTCLKDLWAGRQSNAIPASCKNMVEGSSRTGARLQYQGIVIIAEPNRLMARAAVSACCRMRPQAAKLTVQVGGRISGDKKCAAHKIGKDSYQEEYGFPNYEMNCSAWRAQGICG
jgi:hypothetical protein